MEIAPFLMPFADHKIEAHRGEQRDILRVETGALLDSRYRYQIWSDKRELLLLSADAPREQIAPLEQVGFETRRISGEDMRTYVAWSDDRGEAIIIAEPLRFRQSFIGTFHTNFLLEFLASLPLLLAATWWMFRRATRSLGESALQIVDRSPNDLRPITVSSPPEELKPLLKSTNELFARFGKALESERRLTAAAAHELRTPLAAVKMQAQVAQRARTRKELTGALQDLGLCIDRASRMLEQLLTLARLEALNEPQSQGADVRVDVVTAGVLQELDPLLKERRIRLSTALAPAQVKGIEFGIAVLMRNLVDNAARYSPPGSEILVETGQDATGCYATVKDAGPGIPKAERERVFQPFYRLVQSRGDGTGIGLSIVRTVIEVHRAHVRLDDSELGGLCASVRFPKEVSPTPAVGKLPIPVDRKIKLALR
jgi:two-component system sensor histidine kinase QseC